MVPPLSFITLLRQRIRQEPRGDVDDRDDPLIRHLGRADDAEGADDLAIDFVRRGDHAALVERSQSRLAADEQVHAVRTLAQIEKMKERSFLLEDFEQPAQPVHVRRQIRRGEEVLLAGHHEIIAIVGECGVPGVYRRGHQTDDIFAQLLQLVGEQAADGCERLSGVVVVEEIRRFDQLRWRVLTVGMEDAILHVAIGGHDDKKDAPLRQPQKLDVPKRGFAPPRRRYHTRELSERRKELRRGADQRLRAVSLELILQLANLALVERVYDLQPVDEEAIALSRGYPTVGSVRAGDEAHLLEVVHDVAYGRRRELEPGLA